MKKIKITALMPMRHKSERIPGKNYKKFSKNGDKLFEVVLKKLIKTNVFNQIIINTDSPIIKKICKKKYSKVIIHNRPKNLRDGSISMNKIIKHDIVRTSNEIIFQTHSTNPLIKIDTIIKAVKFYLKNVDKIDSLFSVNDYQNRLWNSKVLPVNHNPKILQRTQDLSPLYEENSLFYIFKKNKFLKFNNRLAGKLSFFRTDIYESVDIDNPINFDFAKLLHDKKK